jgi:methionyl-tRNA synthetase
MTHRNFDGAVPQPGALDERDERLIADAVATVERVATDIEAVHLKSALAAAMGMAQAANAYLSETEPWKTAKTDRDRTATSLYTALCVINALKVALYPFLPFSCQQIHEYLGFAGKVEATGWRASRPEPGTRLLPPEPLFRKIELPEVEGEARLSA